MLAVMVAWIGGMMTAADRNDRPSFLLLPLMAIWANLHGGFMLRLALIALEAVWSVEPARRVRLAPASALFALGAIAASCCTPYGWNRLLGAAKILDLGELLSPISEWWPANFSSFSPFEGALLGLIGFALYRGLVSLRSANSSADGFDLDSACQEHRGICVPGPTGAGEADGLKQRQAKRV
jgi:hypothetical protein